MEKQKVSDDLSAPVSVVIPCFRCKDTIERALNSIEDQTFKPSEVILVDDFSDDGTVEALRNLALQHPLGWIQIIALDKNAGPANARNVGWNAASYEFVAFLDADDSWHPKKIETQINWMQANKTTGLLGHQSMVIIDAARDALEYTRFNDEQYVEVTPWRLLLSNQFSTSSVMLRKNINLRFVADGRYCEDYDLWLQIAFQANLCVRSNHRHTFMYKSPYGHSGLSSHLWLMQKGELKAFKRLRRQRKIDRFQYSIVCLVSYLKFAWRTFKSLI